MNKILTIIFLFLAAVSFGQMQKGTIQYKYYDYCTENLSRLEAPKAYPLFKTEDLCSIKACFRSISYPEINEVIYKRIVELARLNFKNNVLLYLIEGKGSVELADKRNETISDDNGFIYISVDDSINADEIRKGVELYNSETKKLMK